MRSRSSQSQDLFSLKKTEVAGYYTSTQQSLLVFDEDSLRVDRYGLFSLVGRIMKSSPSPPPAFVRVSERDLTEIELHSVDSINDLHRSHSEQNSKGVQPPRPPPPSTNGNIHTLDRLAFHQTPQTSRRPCGSSLNNLCSSNKRRYFLACTVTVAFLLTLILIFSFLVKFHATSLLQ
ncbi:hypothetical protein DNTS_022672 [Danionella cerebrum]|uniref:Uncharacterized protein n=1 Tax=Danionella cerebrum TaxID=2873325 RepID=A0A553RKI8_9TELE|nr:hypothetical protein DNTS_022672 [Danionella translucida]